MKLSSDTAFICVISGLRIASFLNLFGNINNVLLRKGYD